MVAFPNAKINLGLHVVSKRADGYHNLETVFYPIPLKDILELKSSDQVAFSSTGIEIPQSLKGNLVIQAYDLLAQDFNLPPLAFHLHKLIPIGAGLGGGSADASFCLKMLNERFELGCSGDQLERYAVQIGADCPFFIQNTPVYATGIGDQFSPCEVDLEGYHLVLLYPGIHVSTQTAYAGVKPKASVEDLRDILKRPVNCWKGFLKNDFEPSVFAAHPVLEEMKGKLYDKGALYASMSGSGSTMFGIFEEDPAWTEESISAWTFAL